MNLWQKSIITSLTAFLVSSSLLADQNVKEGGYKLSLKSEINKTTLIELYTSQGCSSCPPAEQYLNSLKQHPALWKTYIPVAFHVDYWDYIGWKDQFALPENTSRQRQYAKVNQQRTIYTPAFFVNGKPWRRSFYDRNPDVEEQQAGILKVDLQGNKLTASFSPATELKGSLVLNIALAGMGYQSHIDDGEREGSHPKHDFILLTRTQHQSANLKWQATLPEIEHKGATKLAIVAWVSKKNDPRPIQSVGGYLK